MLADYQRKLRAVCFDREPSERDVLALGDDPEVWRVYRRMVRARLRETIDHGFERLIAVMGAEAFSRLADRFFAEQPPRSPYLREVPGELLEFLERVLPGSAEHDDVPPFALDLARFEWAELDCAYSAEEARAEEVVPLEMDRPAVLSRSHRLLHLGHPVQRIDADANVLAVPAEPVWLCLYRDARSFEVRTLELTPVTFAMLEEVARTTRPLSDVVRSVAERTGATIDVAFVEALSTVLADFLERGLLLGSLASWDAGQGNEA